MFCARLLLLLLLCVTELLLRPRRGGVGAQRAAAAAAEATASREDDLFTWRCLLFAARRLLLPVSPVLVGSAVPFGSTLLPPSLPVLVLLAEEPDLPVVASPLVRPTLKVLDRGDAAGLKRGWLVEARGPWRALVLVRDGGGRGKRGG